MEIYEFYESQFISTQNNSETNLKKFIFLCLVIVLVGFGLLVLYSASYNEALQNNLSGHYYVLRQAVFAVAGFLLFALIQLFSVDFIKKLLIPFFIFTVVLMLLTFSKRFGVEKFGARRWLQIGSLVSFQPSELLKVSVVLLLSKVFASDNKLASKRIYALGILMFSSILIFLQKDYSTALVFLLVTLALLLIGKIGALYIILSSVALIIPATIFLFMEPYRIRRVVSFLFPSIDPSGLNWQVQNSLKAIKGASFFGKGLGNGVYKLNLIPEVHSDFIFASLVEETGFIGVLFFFALFFALGVIGFTFALKLYKEKKKFEATATFGLTFMIIWQALINIGVVCSLLPPTGIPLPFFSQGGTNLFMVIGECGLLYSFLGSVNKGELR
ncbi:MAG: FtsW/RodA/SpoVE family cell cycle protein [Sphaerochaetaceae bacterium]